MIPLSFLEDFTKLQDALLSCFHGVNVVFAFISCVTLGNVFINYDLPTNHENDVHRSGRWGLFGRKSVAINFATEEDKKILYDFETFYNTTVEQILMNVADLI